MSALHRAALWYIRHGWFVLLLQACSKIPLTAHGVKDATRDPRVIAEWWTRYPDANVGIATGAQSGIIVLDVDPRHGGDHSLDVGEEQHGKLPDTVEALTGGGGRHLLFAHPGGVVPNRIGLRPGLDIKADGGYIVVPPSIHPNGQRYEWEASSRPGEVAIAAPPAWLLALMRSGGGREPGHTPPQTDRWRELAANGASEGARNDAVARLTGHLLRKRVDPLVTLELMRAWNETRCKPPLTETELVRTANSIARRERQRRGSAS